VLLQLVRRVVAVGLAGIARMWGRYSYWSRWVGLVYPLETRYVEAAELEELN